MLHCYRCSANLPDDVIYCLSCGAYLMSEQETVLKKSFPSSEPSARPLSGVIKATALATGVIALAFAFYVLGRQSAAVPTTTNTPNVPTLAKIERNEPPTTPVAMPASSPTPLPTIAKTPRPRPTVTPISIDEMRAEIEDREIRERMQRERAIANAINSAPQILPPPVITEYNRNGERLRAICNNGEPSYWQLDKWATCGMNGGVKRWNPRHPKN